MLVLLHNLYHLVIAQMMGEIDDFLIETSCCLRRWAGFPVCHESRDGLHTEW